MTVPRKQMAPNGPQFSQPVAGLLHLTGGQVSVTPRPRVRYCPVAKRGSRSGKHRPGTKCYSP